MSVLQTRGGVPRVFRESIPTTGIKYRMPFFSSAIMARNMGANEVRLYFTEEDYTANANYVTVPVAAAATPHGEWAGPVEAGELWFRAITAASTVEVTVFQRRG